MTAWAKEIDTPPWAGYISGGCRVLDAEAEEVTQSKALWHGWLGQLWEALTMARGRKKRRRARGLVVGHLERVSGDVFVNRSDAITELAGNRPGIYALYKNSALYYVGLARKLRLKGRVKSHLRDRHAGKWNSFSMYFVRSERYLKDLESLAIRIAYPKGNKARGKFGGAPDLRRMLRKKMLHSAREEIDALMGRTARPLGVEPAPPVPFCSQALENPTRRCPRARAQGVAYRQGPAHALQGQEVPRLDKSVGHNPVEAHRRVV